MGRHFTAPQFLGLSCDTTACTVERMSGKPLDGHSDEAGQWIADARDEGWSIATSVRCPEHSAVDHG